MRTAVAGPAAEHRAEDVGEAGRVESALSGTAGESRAAHAELSDGVVLLALLLVAQYVVCFGDVLEFLFGLFGFVQIRMVFACQLAVRFRDIGFAGVLGDTEDFVEILAQPFILSHLCLQSS